MVETIKTCKEDMYTTQFEKEIWKKHLSLEY